MSCGSFNCGARNKCPAMMGQQEMTYAEVVVEGADRLHLRVAEREVGDLEVHEQAVVVVALGDDRHVLLHGPPEEDLRGGFKTHQHTRKTCAKETHQYSQSLCVAAMVVMVLCSSRLGLFLSMPSST